MTRQERDDDAAVPAIGRSGPEDRPAAEKLRLLTEAMRLPDEELGSFLRKHGLHEAELREWRQAVLAALGTRGGHGKDTGRVRELERELRRKEKALAEAAALLVLRGKLQALWEEEGESTPRS